MSALATRINTSTASVASMAKFWSTEDLGRLSAKDASDLRFCLERAADLLSEPVKWEDVAEEAVGVMKVAVDAAAKKAADEIYARVLESSMDYLEENLRFNIASTLATANRERAEARSRVAELRSEIDKRNDLLRDLLEHSIAHYGTVEDDTSSIGSAQAAARHLARPEAAT